MLSQSSPHVVLRKQFQQKIAALWPAMKGSLAKVYKPCIRSHCSACQRGDQHPAWIWSFTDQEVRRCMYVSEADVAFLRHGLKNGRRLERILYQIGPAFLKQQRQQRNLTKSRRTTKKMSKS